MIRHTRPWATAFRASLTFCVGLGISAFLLQGSSASAAPPATAPSSAPASAHTRPQLPASRPSKSRQEAVKHSALIQFAADGRVLVDGKVVTMMTYMDAVSTWKSRKTALTVQIDPKAPYSRVRMVVRVLRLAQLSWKEEVKAVRVKAKGQRLTDPLVPRRTPLARRAAPQPVRPAARLVPRQPKAQQPKVRALPVDPKIAWAGVPLKTIEGASGLGSIELRVQLVLPDNKEAGAVFTGLARIRAGRRVPIGRISTDANGRTRYRFRPMPGESFRLATLYDEQFLEYPVPLGRSQGGVLYLRVRLTPKGAKIRANPIVGGVTKPMAPRKPARPAKRRPPAKPKAWSALTLTKTKGLDPKRSVELRLILMLKDGSPVGEVATGLVRRDGKKREPLGRYKTDAFGRIRYLITPPKKGSLELIVLFGARFHVQPLTFSLKGKNQHTHKVTLPFQNLNWDVLNVLVEPVSPTSVQITHFVSVTFRGAAKTRVAAVRLPLPKGAKNVQMGKLLRGMKVQIATEGPKRGLLIDRLPNGTHRLAYAYRYAVGKDRILRYRMPMPGRIQQVGAFIHPAIKLQNNNKKLEIVKLGEGKQKRPFQYFPIGVRLASQILSLQMLMPKPRPKLPKEKGLVGWIKRAKVDPNSRNKLIGFSVLISLSLLGLLLMFGTKRRPTPKPDSTATSENQESE